MTALAYVPLVAGEALFGALEVISYEQPFPEAMLEALQEVAGLASPALAAARSYESERNARETVNSFRRLALEEIQTARPLRIKVITVQPGDTVESLSHRMSGVDRPTERFRILNGLDTHAQVKVRDLVKIVVD